MEEQVTQHERALICELLREGRMKAAHCGAVRDLASRHTIDGVRMPDNDLDLLHTIAALSRRCEAYILDVARSA